MDEIKDCLIETFSTVSGVEMFIWDQSVHLYIVKENRLISKIDVKPWVRVLIEDIWEFTFTPDGNPIEKYLSEDQEHNRGNE